MIFKIKQYKDIKQDTWDDFVKSNSMGWAYHLYDLIALDWDVKNPNMSFAIVDTDNNDNIYFIMQMHKKNENTLFSRWGYVLKDNLPPKTFKKIKNCFNDYIDKLQEELNISSFTCTLPPLTEANLPQNCSLINPMIHLGFYPGVRYTSVVDLSKPDERMLADCEETTRQAIRKIEKLNQYEIIMSNGSREDFQTYINLHKKTFTRTDGENKIKEDLYHENMFFNLIPKKLCYVFFLKDKLTDKYVANVAILVYKNTAYYWWGASENDISPGLNKYLLFNIILKMKQHFNNSGYFETGSTYPHLRTNSKSKGMSDYKKCFGVFLHPIYKGDYRFLTPIKKKPKKLNSLQKVFSIVNVSKHKQICFFGVKIKIHKKLIKNKSEKLV